MPVDFSVTNQKASPAIYASSFATRPAASFKGRLFVDTDNPSTGIYRDTGTAWVAIAGSAAEVQDLNSVCTVGNTTTTLGIEIFGQSSFGENSVYPFGLITPFENYALTIGSYSEFASSIYTTGNNLFSGVNITTTIEGSLIVNNTTQFTGLQYFVDNAAAIAGGLTVNQLYYTTAGSQGAFLKIVL